MGKAGRTLRFVAVTFCGSTAQSQGYKTMRTAAKQQKEDLQNTTTASWGGKD